MEVFDHQFTELFKQLGLPSDENAIQDFIESHRLDGNILLKDAPFWSTAQAQFLKDGILQDASWAEVIDRLNLAIRAP